MEHGASVSAGITLGDFLGESRQDEAADTSETAGQQSVPVTSGGRDTRGDWSWRHQGWDWYSPWRYRSWGASWYGEASAASAGGTAAADADLGASGARAAAEAPGSRPEASDSADVGNASTREDRPYDPWEQAAQDRRDEWQWHWNDDHYAGWRWSQGGP